MLHGGCLTGRVERKIKIDVEGTTMDLSVRGKFSVARKSCWMVGTSQEE
jgi:hypothetical protein